MSKLPCLRLRAAHALVAALAGGWALAAPGAEVDVRVSNAPPGGMLVFEIFDSANAFGDLRGAARRLAFPAGTGTVYRIPGLRPGTVALSVYYDENGNGLLDRNFIGIPREPVGFSNGYSPKGPPSFGRASFLLEEGPARSEDVTLARPLGRVGRLGLGVGVVGRSSPYRDDGGAVVRVIPAITYIGDRLQIFGPGLRVGLVGSDHVRLAATARYRLGSYEEDDSAALDGMGDREDTLMAGLALAWELPRRVDVSLDYEHDALGRVQGGQASASVGKAFQWRNTRFTPRVGLNWQSSELAAYDYGVTAAQSSEARPEYAPGDTLGPEAGVNAYVEVTTDWAFLLDVAVERLDRDIADSPIVDEDYVTSGFMAVNYVF